MCGFPADGSVRPMRERTGATVTMIATTTAGLTTKGTGIERITAIITTGTVTATVTVIATVIATTIVTTTAISQDASIADAF